MWFLLNSVNGRVHATSPNRFEGMDSGGYQPNTTTDHIRMHLTMAEFCKKSTGYSLHCGTGIGGYSNPHKYLSHLWQVSPRVVAHSVSESLFKSQIGPTHSDREQSFSLKYMSLLRCATTVSATPPD